MTVPGVVVDMVFRRAGAADVEDLYRLSLAFMAGGQLVTRDRAFYAARAGDFRVVEIGGAVVACAGTRPVAHRTEILNVAVDGRWHGLGVGGFLLANLVSELEEAGVRELLVFSTTTQGWFRRHGFRDLEPGSVPAERLALNDPRRRSVALTRRIGRERPRHGASGPVACGRGRAG